ncbi:hypothetical protein Pan265_09310 [Mucisphaera calidilacus]|uniref:Uncharacterized protein n=1 Tax=Mucisphaera calidilacus TaxID=2527982 RepID=A0A518BVT0_9BACT|nr:hypothetical protein Pan265_09310 [Mucisphaera calidilacus]
MRIPGESNSHRHERVAPTLNHALIALVTLLCTTASVVAQQS